MQEMADWLKALGLSEAVANIFGPMPAWRELQRQLKRLELCLPRSAMCIVQTTREVRKQ
jgi:hypothetical protein